MNIDELKNQLKNSINEISVYDLNSYTSIELYYKIANKVNEIIKELSRHEILVSDEIIKQNNALQEMLDVGLHDEVVNKINDMVNDGTMDLIINQNVFGKLNSEIKDKASNSDLAVERARIDSITRLSSGSTTGDAELVDGRIGNNGVTYNNIGDAIRNQTKNVICSNNVSKSFNIESTSTGKIIELPFEMYKGQEIEILISANSTVLSSSGTIGVGVQETNGTYVDSLFNITPNTWNTLTYSKNIKGIRAWIDSSIILSTGSITMLVKHKENIYNQINTLNSKSDRMHSYLYGSKDGEGDNAFLKTIDVNLTADNQSSGYYWTYSLPFDSGKTLYAYVEDKKGILRPTGTIFFGMYDTSNNYTANIMSPKPNTEVYYRLETAMATLVVFIDGNDIVTTGNIVIKLSDKPFEKNIQERLTLMEKEIDRVKNQNSIKGQTISIIGDSYCTYSDWIPTGYACWYRTGGNEDTSNDVASVKDTWWWQLSKETGLSLLINNSYSGSTICTTGYDSTDSTDSAFVTRIKLHNGQNRYLQPKPDIIFVFGGTNDNYANSPVGSVKYSDWSTNDLKSVLPAFCYMINYLQVWNPQARIINIVNEGLKSDITNGMATACNHYGIENLVLYNISKTGGHPNKAGMITIKEQIKAIL